MKVLFLSFIIIFLAPPKCLSAQELEQRILSWLETNNREQLRERLENLKKTSSKSAAPLFLEALIETDAKRAVTLYKEIIKNYRASYYANAALLKLAKYYYMIGSYIVARQVADNMIEKYPKSKFVAEAKYLSLLCLIATKKNKQAISELEKFIKKYPDSSFKFSAQQELNRLLDRPEQVNQTHVAFTPKVQKKQLNQQIDNSDEYSIQIGAYRIKANAIKQKEFMVGEGYAATIKNKYLNSGTLYCVWIESFPTKQLAKNFAKTLKNKYNLSFQVVKR